MCNRVDCYAWYQCSIKNTTSDSLPCPNFISAPHYAIRAQLKKIEEAILLLADPHMGKNTKYHRIKKLLEYDQNKTHKRS